MCLNADLSNTVIRDRTLIKEDWTEKEYSELLKYTKKYEFNIDIKKADFSQLKVAPE